MGNLNVCGSQQSLQSSQTGNWKGDEHAWLKPKDYLSLVMSKPLWAHVKMLYDHFIKLQASAMVCQQLSQKTFLSSRDAFGHSYDAKCLDFIGNYSAIVENYN